MKLPAAAVSAFASAFNRYLQLDPDASTRLADLQGRCIALEFRGLDLTLYVIPEPGSVRLLQQSDVPYVFVANKVDGMDVDTALADFSSLGMGEAQAVAAAHRRGLEAMMDALTESLPAAMEPEAQPEDTDRLRLAIVGRPNVGKSTLVNRLLGEERVLAYDKPGTTRDSIRIELERGCYVPSISREAASVSGATGAALPPHEIRYCRADDGVAIAYSVAGSGYPVFLLPNWMSHLEADLRNPMLRHYWIEFVRRYRVIRFDCRGFGLSDRDVPDFTIDTLVSDMHSVVTTLGLERFAVFGPSGGTLIATAYAARYPDRVSHVAALGGFVRGPVATGDPQVLPSSLT